MRLGPDLLELDLYEVLGVRKGATPEAIRLAYRRLARLHHPDLRHHQHAAAERKMMLLNIARSVLLDPVQRGLYDQLRAAPAASSAYVSWYARPSSPRAPDAWVEPPIEQPADPRERSELADALRRWPERMLFLASVQIRGWPPIARAAVTAGCFMLGFALIACARPRPLFQESGMTQPIAIVDSDSR